MTAREAVRLARRRFRCAVNAQFDATGSIVCRHIAVRIACRTGLPVAAVWPGASDRMTGSARGSRSVEAHA